MDGITFDAIGYSKKLAGAGLPAEVAEVMARVAQQDKAELAQNLAAFRVALRDELARSTNERLEHLATKADLEKVRHDLSDQIKDLRADMKFAHEKLQRTMILWLLGIAIPLGGGLLSIMAKTHGWAGF